ncbi:MAG: riboflavin synthase [Planctomycetes bacterium]|nr:riboflavin synthase [Planctomycetota bacterium]
MFTGLVQHIAPVTRREMQPEGLRLWLDLGPVAEGQVPGASIAVAGCCLTIVRSEGSETAFDISPETLSKTRFRDIQVGDYLNLEPALRVGEALGGHFVSGHVDGLGRFLSREQRGDYEVQHFEAPPEIATLLVPKGSVTIDGVSLTVADLGDNNRFSVALIPETLARTTLGRQAEGNPVHMEGDVLGKFVQAYLERCEAVRNTSL